MPSQLIIQTGLYFYQLLSKKHQVPAKTIIVNHLIDAIDLGQSHRETHFGAERLKLPKLGTYDTE